MKKLIISAITMIICGISIAQNPIITHMYTADPTARVINGKLYMYPSSDCVPPEGVNCPTFCMPGYHAFSLENEWTWKDHGWVLKENDVPWGARDTYAMWAPDCIEKDGKFYYFYPAKPLKDKAFRRIGVGVSDSPTGPFKWKKSYIEGVSGIDPGVMVDDDNQAYLFFGGGHKIYGAPLSDDMTKVTKTPIEIQGLPAGYKEAAFPFKHNGKYYLTFAHVFVDEGYTIGYAISDNPMGPYTYTGKIMDNIENGTNHHSIVKYKDNWIVFYHGWALSGSKHLRSVCADYMKFKSDGTIFKVKPTRRGIGTPTLKDTIQVDRYNEIDRAKVEFVNGDEPMGWMVCETQANSYVRFNRVNFAQGVKTVQLRHSCGQRYGSVELHIDNPNGKLIAKWDMKYTGGWGKWATSKVNIENSAEGIHDIFLVFKTDWGNTKTANINWLILE